MMIESYFASNAVQVHYGPPYLCLLTKVCSCQATVNGRDHLILAGGDFGGDSARCCLGMPVHAA